MSVDGVHKADRVTAGHILKEALRWGLARRSAEEIISDSLDRLPAAIYRAAEEIDALPPTLLRLVRKRVEQLRDSRSSPP
jgi:hypothetical protein